MMPDPSINLIPIIVVGVLNMFIGILWYSPYMFGKLVVKSLTKEGEEPKPFNPGIMYVVTTICSLVFAYVLAHIIKFANLNTVSQGAVAGFWVWLGFVVTTVFPGYFIERRPKMLYIIFIVYQFISVAIAGGVLAIWK